MNTKYNFTHIFCFYLITLCMVYFFMLTIASFRGVKIEADVKEVNICIIGIAGSIVGYVVGSTISSRKKDDIIANSHPVNTEPTQPEQTTTDGQ